VRRVVHHSSVSLVVVLVVHLVAVPTVEGEGDPPVAIDIDGPLAPPASFERMQPQAGRVEIPDAGCRLEPRQNPTDLRNVVRVQPSGISRLEEPLQPAALKPDDHSTSVTCNGSLVNVTPTANSRPKRARSGADMVRMELLRRWSAALPGAAISRLRSISYAGAGAGIRTRTAFRLEDSKSASLVEERLPADAQPACRKEGASYPSSRSPSSRRRRSSHFCRASS